ncbi:MAG: hypothetical protein GC138_08690 [Gammaproteobacteria bacterium]|nr:hypothetical protein [Gammaproteobacteria bacterium]
MFLRRTLPLWLTLSLLSLTANAAPRPHTVQDLSYGEILYDYFREDYLSAITRLDLALKRNRLPHHAEEAELLHGSLLFSYGLYDEAKRIFDRLLSPDVDSAVRNQVWFHLARIRHRQGDAVAALDALNKVDNAELPVDLRGEAYQLRGRVLMDLGEYDAAVQWLMEPTHSDEWDDYARFNLGVALIRAGEVAEGRAYLSVLGEQARGDTESIALRDKANLALGYTALREKRGAMAAEYLRKVSLNGFAANPALLGLGWAEVADGHPSLALAPWAELSHKDISEPAVQESLLAIPYILIEAADYRQAEMRYQAAIDAFAAERRRLDRLAKTVRENSVADLLLAESDAGDDGQNWKSPPLPAAFRGEVWARLFSGNEFQSVLRDTRDLRFLADRLREWQKNIVAYKDMVALRRTAYRTRLPRVDDRLSHLDRDAAHRQRDAYAERLQQAENGTAALPSAEELDIEARLNKTGKLLSRYPGDGSLAEQREKLRLLNGVYRWRVNVDHKVRLWAVRKQLNALDQALAETDVRRQELEHARKQAVLGFNGYDDRIARLDATIKTLRTRVDRSIGLHENYLRDLILRDLDRQSMHLRSYEIQARFGLARIYDLAADNGGDSQ